MIVSTLKRFEPVLKEDMLRMQLRPIRNEEEHETALAEIYTLWSSAPGTPEADRLDVLMLLVEDYERQQFPMVAPDPIEMILFVMEANGLKQKDMLPYFGTRARTSEILKRRRPLTLEMIRKLSAGLKIPVELLVPPYPLQPYSDLVGVLPV
jgi:HTH-type transcriptional regulator / antitoxin HigA